MKTEDQLPIHTLSLERNCKGYLYSHFEYGNFRNAGRIPDEEALYNYIASSYRSAVEDGLPLVVVFEKYPFGTRKYYQHKKLRKIINKAVDETGAKISRGDHVTPLICSIKPDDFNEEFLHRRSIRKPEAARCCKEKAQNSLHIPLDEGCLDKSRVVCLGLWALEAEQVKAFINKPKVLKTLPYYTGK